MDIDDPKVTERLHPKQLSLQELEEWKGPVFYISHLAVVNPRSHSKHVMILFNSSHMHEGVYLCKCLSKQRSRLLHEQSDGRRK